MIEPSPRPTGLELYNEIKRFFRHHGIRQATFCKVTGISDGTIANIRLAGRPKEATVKRVREAFFYWPNRAPEPIVIKSERRERVRPMTLADEVAREAQLAGERRAIARSLATVSDAVMFSLSRPPATIAAAVEGDRRPPAFSRESCSYCQTRGDLGCAHQRPYQAEAA